jgi:hypothetical protein
VPRAKLQGVAGNLGTREGRDALAQAMPQTDILVNNPGWRPVDFGHDGPPSFVWHRPVRAHIAPATVVTQRLDLLRLGAGHNHVPLFQVFARWR